MAKVPVIVMQLPARTLVWADLTDEDPYDFFGTPVLVIRGFPSKPGEPTLSFDGLPENKGDYVIVGPAWTGPSGVGIEMPELVKRWKRLCRERWAETPGIKTGAVLDAPETPDTD